MLLPPLDARLLLAVHVHVGVQEGHVAPGRRAVVGACLVHAQERLEQVLAAGQLAPSLLLLADRRALLLRDARQHQFRHLCEKMRNGDFRPRATKDTVRSSRQYKQMTGHL